ncbi:hypothetical protein PM082_024226 [Marasmius tenuissimus]|nr:hypothetical protein PM082_024226 [Marasmius tenuissimus]
MIACQGCQVHRWPILHSRSGSIRNTDIGLIIETVRSDSLSVSGEVWSLCMRWMPDHHWSSSWGCGVCMGKARLYERSR